MYPRTEYEMTEKDLEEILDACKPVPMIMLNIGTPSSPQENANRAWEKLGLKMGFDHMTVRPIQGKGDRFFTAVPSETESHKQERIKKEEEVKRLAEIDKLNKEINELTERLHELESITPSPKAV